MKRWIIGLAFAVLALTPIAVIAIVQGDDLIKGLTGQPTSRSRGNEGELRDETLAKLTTRYVTQGRHVTMAMRDGAELAPIEFLNAELERSGAKWRVGSVDGVTAETYAVS